MEVARFGQIEQVIGLRGRMIAGKGESPVEQAAEAADESGRPPSHLRGEPGHALQMERISGGAGSGWR